MEMAAGCPPANDSVTAEVGPCLKILLPLILHNMDARLDSDQHGGKNCFLHRVSYRGLLGSVHGKGKGDPRLVID